MRRADRALIATPPSLAEPSDAVTREKNEAKTFYSTYVNGAKFVFKEYKPYDVKVALRALFDGKCAYCECELGDNLEVEHFRPKAGVTEEPTHLGYWWLAHTWDNLLPSCIPCNRKRAQHLVSASTTPSEYLQMMARRPTKYYGKANYFPVSGVRAFTEADALDQESPDLLDPTVDEPSQFLQWSFTSGHALVLPKATRDPANLKRAQATIDHFALNRLHLVQSRTQVLSVLRAQADSILLQLEADSREGGDESALARAVANAIALSAHAKPGNRYTAMVTAFIEDFLAELNARATSA